MPASPLSPGIPREALHPSRRRASRRFAAGAATSACWDGAHRELHGRCARCRGAAALSDRPPPPREPRRSFLPAPFAVATAWHLATAVCNRWRGRRPSFHVKGARRRDAGRRSTTHGARQTGAAASVGGLLTLPPAAPQSRHDTHWLRRSRHLRPRRTPRGGRGLRGRQGPASGGCGEPGTCDLDRAHAARRQVLRGRQGPASGDCGAPGTCDGSARCEAGR